MLEQYCRNNLDKYLLVPLVDTFLKLGINSPNSITMLGLLVGLASVPALLLYSHWFASALLIMSGLLDCLDGTLARRGSKQSNVGAAFDILSDRVVEFALIFSFYLQDPSRALLCMLMLGAVIICVTSFLVVGALSANTTSKSFYYSPGLIERAEAFIFFVLMMLIPSAFSALAWLFITLVLYTAIVRMLEFSYQES